MFNLNSPKDSMQNLSPKTRRYAAVVFYILSFLFALCFCLWPFGFWKGWFLCLGLTALGLSVFSWVYAIRKGGLAKSKDLPSFWLLFGMFVLLSALMVLSLESRYPINDEVVFPALLLAGFWLFTMLIGLAKGILWIKEKIEHLDPATAQSKPEPTASKKTVPFQSKPKTVQIHPQYQQYLDELQQQMLDLQQRQDGIAQFLDSCFQGSSISKSRYMNVLGNATRVLEANYSHASRAAAMFGMRQPDADRMTIMERYVSDSRDVVEKVETVIDELVLLQQNNTLSASQTLDSLLDDLATTTSLYQQQNQGGF